MNAGRLLRYGNLNGTVIELHKGRHLMDRMRSLLIVISLFLLCAPGRAAEPDVPKVKKIQRNEVSERADKFSQTQGLLISAFESAQQISRLPAEEQRKRIPEV